MTSTLTPKKSPLALRLVLLRRGTLVADGSRGDLSAAIVGHIMDNLGWSDTRRVV
jgi:hypothetical protein